MYCFVIFQKGLRSVFDESSQTAWFFCTTSNIYRYIPKNSHKTLTNYIPKFSGWITLSIGEIRMKIRAVVFEFIASRQTNRREGGLCFIICIDNDIKMEIAARKLWINEAMIKKGEERKKVKTTNLTDNRRVLRYPWTNTRFRRLGILSWCQQNTITMATIGPKTELGWNSGKYMDVHIAEYLWRSRNAGPFQEFIEDIRKLWDLY